MRIECVSAENKLRLASAVAFVLQFYCFGLTVASIDEIACFQVICLVFGLRFKGI